MKLVYGDLWEYPANFRVITTNGSIKTNGENVCGSGCAREMAERYPDMPKRIANGILRFGNNQLLYTDHQILTFPTKHKWNEDSDLELIKKSCVQLAKFASMIPDAVFVLPRPGVGAGKLDWSVVEPVIAELLPDNVHVITWK